ncbi:MAG: hypothetical protein BIFFINMI_03598 [Phycisphaerae bacterium]|nr:hypothetical protein [Phycisphaerae bacterium]
MSEHSRRQKELEAWVVHKFVECLNLAAPDSAKLVEVRPEHSSPDIELLLNGNPFFLELGAYHVRYDSRCMTENYDSDFQRQLCEAWVSDKAVRPWTVRLRYRETSSRVVVPMPPDRPAVIDQLKQLVKQVDLRIENCQKRVRFVPETRVSLYRSASQGSDNLYLSEDAFPKLAESFGSIGISYNSDRSRQLAPKTPQAYWGGVDTQALGRLLDKKILKLAGYKEKVGEGAIGLLIHADGVYPSTHIPIGELEEKAIPFLREAISQSEIAGRTQFDAVWIIDQTACDQPTLVRI